MACNCGKKNNKWAEMVYKRELEAKLKKKQTGEKGNVKVEGSGREN